MKLSIPFAFLLALFLTACSTLEVGLEMTSTPSSPHINQSEPTAEPTKVKIRPTDPAPTSVSPTTTSAPTARPSDTPVPTKTSQPTPSPLPATSTPRVPTATPTAKATIAPSPTSTPVYDWYSANKLPKPLFFFKSEEGKLYYANDVSGGRLSVNSGRHLVDWETFLNLGYQENDIIDYDAAPNVVMLMNRPEGAPLTRLIKGWGDEVYWMENGFRRHIPDMDTFRQLGYRPEDIFQVSDDVLRSWPLGESLPSVLGTPPEPIPAPSQELVVSEYTPFDRNLKASELYTVYTDGRNPRRLSYTKRYTWHGPAAWSPDGQLIAFSQCMVDFSPTKTGCVIGVTNPERWNQQRLAEGGLLTGPNWSPDGTHLVFSAYTTQGTYSIMVMDVAGGNAQPLSAENGGWVAWTTEGRIAFWAKESDSSDKYKLMVMDADGQNVQPVQTQATVLDQRFYPWRQGVWLASGSPHNPTGR